MASCSSVKLTLSCPAETSTLLTVMNIKLTQNQIDQLDNLISQTIIPALYEDVCVDPDMSDMVEDHPCFDDTYQDRLNVLYVEALTYIKNNLH